METGSSRKRPHLWAGNGDPIGLDLQALVRLVAERLRSGRICPRRGGPPDVGKST